MPTFLRPLDKSEEDIFILENQTAFDKAAIEEFGPQKESVIHRETIVECIHGKFAESFRIIADGKAVGGVIVDIHTDTPLCGAEKSKSIMPFLTFL